MKALYSVAFCLLAASAAINAQTISLSTQTLQFDTIAVNVSDSLAFHIRNGGATPATVVDINTTKPAFTVKDTAFTVPPFDSAQVWVYFKTNHNVTWKDVLLVEMSGANGALPLRLIGTARFTDTYYSSTQGLWENALKTALLALVNNHTVLGYNTGRDRMFETVDDPGSFDSVECVYTGRRIHAATRTEAQNQSFNTEHTWPQSFFNSADPMVSDLNHLYPTDNTANSMRSNYPFGPVVSNITWQVGGSKLGRNPNGIIVFEPRDTHKGDVARSLFYFLIRYPSNYGGFMDQSQETYLRQWYKSDPVSAKETARNNAVASFQGKRNPLIDHAEFIDRITYFRSSTTPPVNPEISISPSTITFGVISPGDSVEWKVIVVNSGLAPLNITGLSLQQPTTDFRIIDTPSIIPIDSFAQVRVRFTPTIANQSYTNTLVIQNNDTDEGTVSIPLSGSSSGVTSVNDNAASTGFALLQNYPNPFNPTTSISIRLSAPGYAKLKVYDILGSEIATIFDGIMEAGEHRAKFDASGLPSGLYFYRLTADGNTLARKMLLLK